MRGCLEDLAGQTLFAAGELQIVVINSASPQGEDAIIREFVQKHPGQFVYIRTEERETLYAAWNRGIRASGGEYLTNANVDDRHHPQALQQMAGVPRWAAGSCVGLCRLFCHEGRKCLVVGSWRQAAEAMAGIQPGAAV